MKVRDTLPITYFRFGNLSACRSPKKHQKRVEKSSPTKTLFFFFPPYLRNATSLSFLPPTSPFSFLSQDGKEEAGGEKSQIKGRERGDEDAMPLSTAPAFFRQLQPLPAKSFCPRAVSWRAAGGCCYSSVSPFPNKKRLEHGQHDRPNLAQAPFKAHLYPPSR